MGTNRLVFRAVKILITIDVCDLCHDDDPESTTAATVTRTITLDGREPREVPVCQPHDEKLVRLFGGVANRPSVLRQSEMWDCPICEESVRRGGAVLHLWRHTTAGRPPAQPKKCPNCKQSIPDPRGMSRHRMNTHQWDAMADALANAEKDRKRLNSNGGAINAKKASASAASKRRTAKV